MSEASGGITSKTDYNATPYSDASWEVVGERQITDKFTPMDVDVLPTDAVFTDPMFEDYGGVDQSGSPKRWHLPQNLAYKPETTEEHRREAEAELKRQEEELQAIRTEAYNSGLVDGAKQGQADAAKEIQANRVKTQTLIQDLQKQVREYLEATIKQSIELSLQVAKCIVESAVEVNPEYIVPLVREALQKSGGAVIRAVKVSPEDFEFIEFIGAPQITPEYDQSWHFEKDETIRSGCVVETSSGTVDFQLDAAWERIRDQVIKVIR